MKQSREENNDFSSQDKELTKLIESASRSSDSSGSSGLGKPLKKQMKQESANQMAYREYLGEEKKKGLSACKFCLFKYLCSVPVLQLVRLNLILCFDQP
eukprot:g73127.t1